jgi:hypothetical protein
MIRTGTPHIDKSIPIRPSALKSSKEDNKTISTYSTLDVSRILGIEKSRVRHWIVEGFIIPSWHIAMARGDKNLLTYDDLCSVYLFQQLLAKGLHRASVSFIISGIAKTGLSHVLEAGFRYAIWNTKNPREGGMLSLSKKMPNSMIGTTTQMLIIDLLHIKREVDRKRIKRGG